MFGKIGWCMMGMLFVATSSLWAAEGETVLFDFENADADEQWRSVNDNVMGGISQGTFRITDQGTMEFFGSLSLENRGGFASVRCRPTELNLSEFETVAIRVRGDGRKYYCNLYVPSRRTAFSHRAAFQTKADQWQEIRIPLKDFRATWFGRTLPDAPPVDLSKVNSMGFILADKKVGPFKLEIDWIKAVGKPAMVAKSLE